MARTILALDCGSSAFKAALCERSFGEVRVLGVWSQPRNAQQPESEQLRQFCTQHQLQADTVVTCLPGDVVTHRFLSLPFAQAAQIRQTVPFELETQIPFELEEMLFDFHIVESQAGGSRVLAAAVPQHIVQQHLELCATADLDPTLVEIAPLAPLGLLSAIKTHDTDNCCFLDIGERRASLAAFRNGILVGVRTLSVGIGHIGGFGRFIQELGWTLAALQSKDQGQTGQPACFILAGGGAHIIPLRVELEKVFAVPVLPLSEVSLPLVPEAYRIQQTLFANCLGLLQRESLRLSTPRLNLRQGAFAYQEKGTTQRSEWRRLGWLSAGMAAAASLALSADMYRLDTRYQALKQEIRHVFQTTLPDVRTIVSEKLQLEEAVASLETHTHRGARAQASPLEILRQLSTAFPERIRLDLEEVVIDGQVVRLRGTADSFDAAEAITIAARELELFQEVQLKDVKTLVGRKKVSFQLNLRTL